MSRKTLATLGILVVLLVSIVGTAAGQTGDEPVTTPTPEVEETETTYYAHPIVQLLSKYFGRDKTPDTDPSDAEETPDPDATPDPEATEVPDDMEEDVLPIDEQIAAYHEDGMGFGVLVKLYAMAEESEEACAAQAEDPVLDEEGNVVPCEPLVVQDLVDAFKSGTGIGLLFKEHGKPAMLGVGHVRKAVKEMEATEEPTEEVIEDGDVVVEEELDVKGNKPVKPLKTPKVKTNNGRPPQK